jgi:hypothetical protein
MQRQRPDHARSHWDRLTEDERFVYALEQERQCAEAQAAHAREVFNHSETLAEVEHLRVRNAELKSAIEDYRLWRPGEKGHAAAHRKLMEVLD